MKNPIAGCLLLSATLISGCGSDELGASTTEPTVAIAEDSAIVITAPPGRNSTISTGYIDPPFSCYVFQSMGPIRVAANILSDDERGRCFDWVTVDTGGSALLETAEWTYHGEKPNTICRIEFVVRNTNGRSPPIALTADRALSVSGNVIACE